MRFGWGKAAVTREHQRGAGGSLESHLQEALVPTGMEGKKKLEFVQMEQQGGDLEERVEERGRSTSSSSKHAVEHQDRHTLKKKIPSKKILDVFFGQGMSHNENGNGTRESVRINFGRV